MTGGSRGDQHNNGKCRTRKVGKRESMKLGKLGKREVCETKEIERRKGDTMENVWKWREGGTWEQRGRSRG